MPVLSDYVSGTITVTNGSTAFTGTGTLWRTAGFREGDTVHLQNLTAVIAGSSMTDPLIAGNGAGNFTEPWTGASGTYAYRMRILPDNTRVTAQTTALIELLGTGNLSALAGLQAGVDQVPYFIAPGVMGLLDLASLGGGGSGGSWDVIVSQLSGRDEFNDRPAEFRVLVINSGTGRSAVYAKTGGGAIDWTSPIYFTGPLGADGDAATLTVGTVNTGAAGSAVQVVNSGTDAHAVLNFTLPEGRVGQTGPANKLTIGTIERGVTAAATITGDAPNQTINLTLPQGNTGSPGNAATIAVGAVTTGAAGTQVSVTNSGTSSAAVLDITIPRGADGAGAGDMKSSDYDPANKMLNVYDMDSMGEGEINLILTPDERQDIAGNKYARHGHENKNILDQTTSPFTIEQSNHLGTIAPNADVTTTARVGAALAAPTPSTDLVDGDKLGGIRSGGATTATWSWATIKAAIKIFTDTLYATATQGGKADTAVQPAAMVAADNLRVAIAGSNDLTGYMGVAYDIGNITAGATIKPVLGNGNYQALGHSGSFTLQAPDGVSNRAYDMSIFVTSTVAGILTATGFNVVTGTFKSASPYHKLTICRRGSNWVELIIESKAS